MFGYNSKLGSDNNYREGYNEGVDDVLIQFSEMLEKVKAEPTYRLLQEFYSELSTKFPQKNDPYEE